MRAGAAFTMHTLMARRNVIANVQMAIQVSTDSTPVDRHK